MDISSEKIIGHLVAQDYRTASVFKRYGIDFCCNGNRSIVDACNDKGLDTAKVLENLHEAVAPQQNGNTDYKSWPLDLLTDYIEKKHHRYVRSKIEEIAPFLNKVVKVHGGHHPELLEVQELFVQSAIDLSEHMQKEEKMLFPHIRKMVADPGFAGASFSSVKHPIAMMHHEHDIEGERFRRIAELTGNYIPPADACNTYVVTFALLKEFEEDLHLHIHLENNILFPKAIKMEAQTIPVQ